MILSISILLISTIILNMGGESLGDDLSKLNPEDMPDENAEKSED